MEGGEGMCKPHAGCSPCRVEEHLGKIMEEKVSNPRVPVARALIYDVKRRDQLLLPPTSSLSTQHHRHLRRHLSLPNAAVPITLCRTPRARPSPSSPLPSSARVSAATN